MNFSHSDKVRELQRRLTAFMERFVYPAESRFQDRSSQRTAAAGIPGARPRSIEDLKRERARRKDLESVPAGLRARRRAHESRVCALVRDHGTLAPRVRRPSIARRPTPATWRCWLDTARRSSRSAGSSRCSRAESARLRDDRTRGRLERRDQYQHPRSCATAIIT